MYSQVIVVFAKKIHLIFITDLELRTILMYMYVSHVYIYMYLSIPAYIIIYTCLYLPVCLSACLAVCLSGSPCQCSTGGESATMDWIIGLV